MRLFNRKKEAPKPPSDTKVVTDGWVNMLTGISTKLDKSSYNSIFWTGLDRDLAESLFSADPMASKIASCIPDDGTREGIDWIIPSPEETVAELTKYLDSEFDRLSVWKNLQWAWTLARVYGGALVYVSIDDGKEVSEPVDFERVQRIASLTVFDRYQFTIQQDDIVSSLDSPEFGKPLYYNFNFSNNLSTTQLMKVHHSRVLRFDGQRLPYRLYCKNQFWHDSIFSKLYKSIRSYSTSLDAAANLLTDFNQPVFKIEGLAESLSLDEGQTVMKRIETVNLSRSMARAVILDKQDEFQQIGASVSGLPELLRLQAERLVAGTNIPHTRLLGESPNGSNATGNSTQRDYYDSVKAAQELNLRKPLDDLHALLFLQADAPDKPEGFTFAFRSLYQTDESTKITTRKVQADIDAIYIDRGVVDPMQVAQSRFGSGEFSFETSYEEPTGGQIDYAQQE